MKSISVKKLVQKKFKVYDFENEWKDSFGTPETNAQWIVYGESGNGKTEFCVQLAHYYCNFGKVAYISLEQGISSSLQSPFTRYDFKNQPYICKIFEKNTKTEGNVYEQIKAFVAKTTYKTIIIDSLNSLKVTPSEYIELSELAKKRKRTLVNVAWGKGNHPSTSAGEQIEFMVDIKLQVKKYAIPEPKSRFGGNMPYVIWEDKAKEYHYFINQK